MDQLAFLTMAGISYAFNNDGSARTGSTFSNLAFAADVRVPSSLRHVRALAAGGIAAGSTAAVAAGDFISYSSIVDLGVHAKTHYVKPLMAGGKEFYVMFVRPEGMAQLDKLAA